MILFQSLFLNATHGVRLYNLSRAFCGNSMLFYGKSCWPPSVQRLSGSCSALVKLFFMAKDSNWRLSPLVPWVWSGVFSNVVDFDLPLGLLNALWLQDLQECTATSSLKNQSRLVKTHCFILLTCFPRRPFLHVRGRLRILLAIVIVVDGILSAVTMAWFKQNIETATPTRLIDKASPKNWNDEQPLEIDSKCQLSFTVLAGASRNLTCRLWPPKGGKGSVLVASGFLASRRNRGILCGLAAQKRWPVLQGDNDTPMALESRLNYFAQNDVKQFSWLQPHWLWLCPSWCKSEAALLSIV